MKRVLPILLATTALCTSTVTVANAKTIHRPDTRTHPSLTATLQHDADALLDLGAPGVLVGLDTPRRTIEVRSGFGDLAARTPVPRDARFRIGSFTKTFVAATLLQLVGEGHLSLADPVERWLPAVVAGNGNDGRKITVRQLLQHTSGLPNYTAALPYLFDQAGFEEKRFTTLRPQDLVALAMKSKPLFPPGTDWSYSNTNYILAGMIINSVTGHSWQHEVHTRLIKPLGLRHTYTPRTSPSIPGPHAIGYERFPGPGATSENPMYGEAVDVTLLNPSWGGAAGEMISTVADGNRFLKALAGGKVLRPAELAEMQRTVPATLIAQHWPGARYGLGLLWIANSCGGSWGHPGDIHGFMTRNGVNAKGTRSVMVSLNTDSMVPKAGVPAPTKDAPIDLIDHALCGTG